MPKQKNRFILDDFIGVRLWKRKVQTSLSISAKVKPSPVAMLKKSHYNFRNPVCGIWCKDLFVLNLKCDILKPNYMIHLKDLNLPKISIFFLLLFFLGSFQQVAAQKEKKVVFQAFWWDYWNSNYPNSWANYLTELAPRLKAMGVDAVWIPPSYKNASTSSVGYSPFDHYDLGDKYQKGWDGTALQNTTRVGTKDELLRMIAVMHANGIEVIQDIVLNHVDGAGSGSTGAGGQDTEAIYSMQTASGYKNFRYVSYATPVVDGTACDYAARTGRWEKNYHNFHPHAGHNSTTGDWEASFWGPDLCYGYDNSGTGNGYGQSSNICSGCGTTCYNPTQVSMEMRDGGRDWMMWFKKQTGVDGYRFDAVKHFPHFVAEDYLYNTQVNVGWANGGDEMFAVGEWVGGKAELDQYTSDVNWRAGTFDFGLRAFDGSGGLEGMVTGLGGFDLGALPGAQQNNRFIDISGIRIHRTVPFVNNHDTFRPTVDADGNITGWNAGSELSTHIDPKEPRLAAAYAIAVSMDGNPQIFFEDLFNINNTSARWSHDPKSPTTLPQHSDIEKIMKAHGAFGFKNGDYKVRSSEASHWNVLTSSNNDDDHIIFERSGQAIIAATDAWSTSSNYQESWIDTDFAPGTVLVDYSGGITTTSTVQGDGRVNIKTRDVGYPTYAYAATYTDPGAHYHGYSIWAPQGLSFSYAPPRDTETTQEWEMANDLGDSHCESLGYGGALPDNSCHYRIAGKIFAEAGKNITYELIPSDASKDLTLGLYDLNGLNLSEVSGAGTLSGSFTATATGWYTLKVRNTSDTHAGQVVYVKATYTAPATITDVTLYPVETNVSFWTGNGGDSGLANCRNWEEGKIPAEGETIVIPNCIDSLPNIPPCSNYNIVDEAGNPYTGDLGGTGICLDAKVFLQGPYAGPLMSDDLRAGGYLPLTEPYSGLGFARVGGGGETTTAAILAVTGSDAIIDWVLVELRDAATPATVLANQAALLQADGDIVSALDGVSPVTFGIMNSGNYYISVQHRNHLGVCTGSSLALGRTSNSVVDFTMMVDGNSYGTHSQKVVGGVQTMWAGDGNRDGKVKYAGTGNDPNTTLTDVLLFPTNTAFQYNYDFAFGYYQGDFDMNGKVKYAGAGNDPNMVLINVLTYPTNGSFQYNFDFVLEQLP